jgi:hypothetical protein
MKKRVIPPPGIDPVVVPLACEVPRPFSSSLVQRGQGFFGTKRAPVWWQRWPELCVSPLWWGGDHRSNPQEQARQPPLGLVLFHAFPLAKDGRHHFTAAKKSFGGLDLQACARHKSHEVGPHLFCALQTGQRSQEGLERTRRPTRHALRAPTAFGHGQHRQQCAPFLQRLSATAEPSPWRCEVGLGQLVRACTLVGSETRARLAAPRAHALALHRPCWGPVLRRGKTGPGGVLDTVFRVRGCVRQRVPAGGLLPGTLPDGGCLLFAVIDGGRCGMCVPKWLAPCLESRTMRPHEGSRDPRVFPACFTLLRDDLPVGLRHGADRQRGHLFLTEASPADRQCTQTHTSNAQALLGTQLPRMIHHPDPLVGLLLRASQGIIASAQQPESTGKPGRRRQREGEHGHDEHPHPACPASTGGGGEDAWDKQPHVAHRRGG